MPIHKLHQSKLWEYPDGMHSDGNNLYLQVRGGSRCWIYRSNKCQIGLGSLRFVTLDEARAKAVEILKQEWAGKNPKAEREDAELDQKIKAGRVKTVEEAWNKFFEVQFARKASHNKVQLRVQKHVLAKIGGMPIEKVDANIILEDSGVGLLKLWKEKNTTAKQVRSHLMGMFEFAITRKWCDENPAILKKALPESSEVHIEVNHPAVPYQNMPRFMAKLLAYEDPGTNQLGHTVSALLIRFLALAAVRLGEVVQATWEEIDLGTMIWDVPWQHLKEGRNHRRNRPVPITPQTAAVLEEMLRRPVDHSPKAPAFPSPYGGPYDPSSISRFMRDSLKWDEKVLCNDGVMRLPVLHGFRRTFNNWARVNNFHKDLRDIQLDHKIGTKVDQAYFDEQLFEDRRKMMTAYNDYIIPPTPAVGANITPIGEARKLRRAS
jgi:integrase